MKVTMVAKGQSLASEYVKYDGWALCIGPSLFEHLRPTEEVM
jgi:hypothetical protein